MVWINDNVLSTDGYSSINIAGMGWQGDSGCEGRSEPTSTIDVVDVGFKLCFHGQ